MSSTNFIPFIILIIKSLLFPNANRIWTIFTLLLYSIHFGDSLVAINTRTNFVSFEHVDLVASTQSYFWLKRNWNIFGCTLCASASIKLLWIVSAMPGFERHTHNYKVSQRYVCGCNGQIALGKLQHLVILLQADNVLLYPWRNVKSVSVANCRHIHTLELDKLYGDKLMN